MTIESAYLKFLDIVNKNSTNDNISVDKGRFIYLFNTSQNKYVEWVLDKRNEDEIRYIQKLLVIDHKLKKGNTFIDRESFLLPTNYFDFVNQKTFAKEGECGIGVEMYLHEIKQENHSELSFDYLNKPSLKYRESYYSIGNDSIVISTNNFNIKDVYLTYYRYPKQVDLKGYIKEDGKSSPQDIDPEFDDKVVDKIISICAKDFNINNDEINRANVDLNRVISKV